MSTAISTVLRGRGRKGFGLLEVVIAAGVLIILLAVVTPMIFNYLDDAKKSRAQSDAEAIAKTLLRFSQDVGHLPIYTNGAKMTGEAQIDLLRGEGKDPEDATSPASRWLSTSKIAELENHLTHNNPGTAPYPTGGRNPWRGPYVDKVSPDPWGNRYLVNVKSAGSIDTPKVVWVLSAGPNGKIETAPDLDSDSGPTPGGDDIAVRLK